MIGARPWIAYVCPVAFPDGGAAARRIQGNALALVAAGYDVTIVSGQPPGPAGEMSDVAPGICCASVSERDAEHLPLALRRSRYAFMGARTRAWLEARSTPPAAVILYSGYSPYLLQLTGWAYRSGIALLFDAVEWYTAESVLRFLISPYLWNIEAAMRLLIPRVDGVVVISRELETYYARRGLPVARVPPLFDPEAIMPAQRGPDPGGCLRLAYSGSPAQKDLLDLIVECVLALHDAGMRVVLDVVGMSEAELRARAPLQPGMRDLPTCLRAHGRVNHARSLEVVGQADFTVFLRRVNRVSTCGFPTKFVESLALGTPVITNLTSDLPEHLSDGETGLVCPAPSRTALMETLGRARALDPGRYEQMRSAARAEAVRAFAYRHHADTLNNLIDESRQRLKSRRTGT